MVRHARRKILTCPKPGTFRSSLYRVGGSVTVTVELHRRSVASDADVLRALIRNGSIEWTNVTVSRPRGAAIGYYKALRMALRMAEHKGKYYWF
jgi:hypothetical protein